MNKTEFRKTKLPAPALLAAGDEIHGPIQTWGEYDDVVQDFKRRGITEFTSMPIDVVCDFCSHPVVRHRYEIPAGGVVVSITDERGGLEQHGDADGLWGACAPCHELIQERNWEALASRSYRVWAENNPELAKEIPPSLVAVGITGSHQFFAERWNGSDPEVVEPDVDFLERLKKES